MPTRKLDHTTTLTTNSNNETLITHRKQTYKITSTQNERLGSLKFHRYKTQQEEEFLHIPSQDKVAPPYMTPWYALPNNIEVYLNKRYKRQLIRAAVRKAGGIARLRHELEKHGTSMNAMFVYKHLNDLRDGMPLDKLIPILDYLRRDLNKVNGHITSIGHCRAVEHPKLPFDFGKKHGARLIAARYGDGTLSASRNYGPTFHYANNDSEMRARIVESLACVFGRITILNKEYGNGEVAKVRTFTDIIGYVLKRGGAITGALFGQNPHVPTWIRQGSEEIKREWLVQAFGDEGYIWPQRGKVCIGRATEIDRFLSEDMTNRLKSMRWRERRVFGKYLHYSIAFTDLPAEIRETIERHPPNLLLEEKTMLDTFMITTRMYPQELYHGKQIDRHGVNWVLQTETRNDSRRFLEKIGFPQERKRVQLVAALRIDDRKNRLTTLK